MRSLTSDAVSFPLNYIESLVLPLQGFWNAVIYMSTSVPACRALWATLLAAKLRPAWPSSAVGFGAAAEEVDDHGERRDAGGEIDGFREAGACSC